MRDVLSVLVPKAPIGWLAARDAFGSDPASLIFSSHLLAHPWYSLVQDSVVHMHALADAKHCPQHPSTAPIQGLH